MLKSIAILGEMAPKPEDSLPKTGGLFQKGMGGDLFLIIGVGAALAVLLFLLVYLSREKRARRRGLVRSSRVLYSENGKSNGKVRKRRRSHPDNLPRNPTLGETGGLPPLRPEKSSEPSA